MLLTAVIDEQVAGDKLAAALDAEIRNRGLKVRDDSAGMDSYILGCEITCTPDEFDDAVGQAVAQLVDATDRTMKSINSETLAFPKITFALTFGSNSTWTGVVRFTTCMAKPAEQQAEATDAPAVSEATDAPAVSEATDAPAA